MTPITPIRWRRKDLLGIAELSPEEIGLILDTAESFSEIGERAIKKVPTSQSEIIEVSFLSTDDTEQVRILERPDHAGN